MSAPPRERLRRAPTARFFLALAGIAAAACAAGPPATRTADSEPPTPAARFATEPTIRVGIAWGDSAVELAASGRWWIHEAGSSRPIAVIEGGESWGVVRLPLERALRVVRPDGWLSEPHVGPLEAAPLASRPMEVNRVAYPGHVEILLGPEGDVTAVDVVRLEAYLEGVVPKEIGRPGAGAYDAIRAQAVAARTYALKRMGSRSELGFDVYGTVEDQAYVGVPSSGDSLAVRAVAETRGQALVYNGYLIDALYHSTCGGHTASVEEVFDRDPAPYLTSVSDARPDGGYWCQSSRYFRWSVDWDAAEIQARVRRNLPGLVPLPAAGVGDLVDVELLASSPEGRAERMRVTTSTGTYVVVGNAIRRLFADADGGWLRSTAFLFRPARDGRRIASLSLVGGGWGHGVGMCQVGAMGRARAGQDYRSILTAYYTGAEVATFYR